MDPIRFAILKPVTISVGVLLTVLAGVISLGVIPIQLTPDIDTTVIAVSTRWEGASPQEIETDVVSRQEEKLKGITGLEKMTSTCSLGEGSITLEFRLGTPKAEALRDTSDRLREVRGYPDNVDEPVVRATNPADRDYIAWVVVVSENPKLDIRTLSDFFEDFVEPELERVEGVAEVNILGGFEREAQVVIDPVALANRGITWSNLVGKLQVQNRSASAGQIEEGKRDVRCVAWGDTNNWIRSNRRCCPIRERPWFVWPMWARPE